MERSHRAGEEGDRRRGGKRAPRSGPVKVFGTAQAQPNALARSHKQRRTHTRNSRSLIGPPRCSRDSRTHTGTHAHTKALLRPPSIGGGCVASGKGSAAMNNVLRKTL